MTNARYLYLRSPEDNDHVVTVARVLEDDHVLFAWAVNKKYPNYYYEFDSSIREIVTRQEFLELKKRYNKLHREDQFCKKRGREIALGRVEAGSYEKIPYRKGQVSYDIVKYLAHNAHDYGWAGDFVETIAKYRLQEWEAAASLKPRKVHDTVAGAAT